MHLPRLRRLNLKMVPLKSRHLPRLVEAAAKFCLNLEVLVLPRKANVHVPAKGAEIKQVMAALYAGMERWYTLGGHGGLRQLTLPTRDEADRYRSSTEFLENMTLFCPNIEYLDGPDSAYIDCNPGKCEDRWVVSLETWRKFNATCTKLREFFWAALPFADPFFRVFGEHPKPQLKKLIISPNLLWDWDEYFRACGDSTDVNENGEKRGYGRRVEHIDAMCQSCPALTDVIVEMDLAEYTDSGSEKFDIDVFGDAFWVSVATHCPLVQRLRINNTACRDLMNAIHIESFTDVALKKFSELKYLSLFDSVPALMCSGDAMFEYLRHVTKSSLMASECNMLAFRVGGLQAQSTVSPAFYKNMARLLLRLSETSEEELGAEASGQKFKFALINPFHSTVPKHWSVEFLKKLKPLLASVRAAHPTLNINVTTNRQTRSSFLRIDRLLLSWNPEDSDYDLFWDEGDTHLLRDTTVIHEYNYVGGFDGEGFSDDDSDY